MKIQNTTQKKWKYKNRDQNIYKLDGVAIYFLDSVQDQVNTHMNNSKEHSISWFILYSSRKTKKEQTIESRTGMKEKLRSRTRKMKDQ